MIITVTCPVCGRSSKIDDKFKGKRLRCPYRDCRQLFCVGLGGETFLPSEPREERPPAPAWEMEPPPVRQPGAAAEPEEGSWEPPPVRRPEEEAPPVEVEVEAVSEEVPASVESPTEPVQEVEVSAYEPVTYEPIPTTGRRIKLILGAAIVLGLVVVIVGGIFLLPRWWKSPEVLEASLRGQADQHFKEGRFGSAGDAYRKLVKDYSESSEAPRYQFLADLSDIHAAAEELEPDIAKLHEQIKQFQEKYHQKPQYQKLYERYRKDISEAFVAFVRSAAEKAERDTDPGHLERAEDGFKRLQEAGGADEQTKTEELQKRLAQAKAAVAAAQARKDLLVQFDKLSQEQAPGAVETALQLFEEQVRKHPRLKDDKDLNARLNEFKEYEAAWVKYVPTAKQPERGPPPKRSVGQGLLVCPLVKGNPGTAPPGDPVVLALARGVLYALAQSNGEVRWAMPVGIDAHALPVILPARPGLPELALVVTFDIDKTADEEKTTSTLLAVDVQTGQVQWHYPLGVACQAGPVVVGQRVYLPTVDGKVHELEVIGGGLIGHYEIGLKLTVPAAFDPVQRRLYVPADRRRIYVLDVEKEKRCTGVLYTEHTAGALRGAPKVIGSRTGTTLVTAEASDLKAMKVRALELSAGSEGTVVAEHAYDVPGWSWFPLYFNGDTLGLVTDHGRLALFGLGRGTRDKALFPLAPPLTLEDAPAGPNPIPPDRPQIVHVDLNQWWVLHGGELRRYQFDLYRRELVTVPLSKELAGERLGTPLHDSQHLGRAQRLVLVTQSPDQPRCLATAIDLLRGTIVWQRQLGMVMSEAPHVVGNYVLAMDQIGGLFHVPVTSPLPEDEADWLVAGQWLDNGPKLPSSSRLVTISGQPYAVALTYIPSLQQVLLRKYEAGKGITWQEAYNKIESPPAGTPTLGGQFLIVPCRDGNLYEFPVHRPGKVPPPLVWRDPNAGPQAVGHAILLSDKQLLTSDGFRKLQAWERPAGTGQSWQRLTGSEIFLEGQIATPPLVLGDSEERQVCVGDDNGTLYLCSLRSYTIVRRWPLKGKITQGPFLRGTRIGCVVDQDRLVWLDPASSDPVWEYQSSKPGICGEPQLDGERLLVTELSGVFTWLDPEDGKKVHQKALSRRVVPATAAIPLVPGRSFAPLSDGTILLLTAPTSEEAASPR